ncbi:MAG: hypothetical protein ACRCYR_19360 [Phycicoccus sp.]
MWPMVAAAADKGLGAARMPSVPPHSLVTVPDQVTPPESVETYAARVAAAQDAAGRLALDPGGVVTWDVFPFEADGLRLRPGPFLAAVEEPREGEDPATCPCTSPASARLPPWPVVWEDDDWRLKAAPPSGSPLVLILEPRRHVDVGDLPDDLAAAYGRLQVALVSAVEALPSVARCHVLRIGDGGAHAHLWFIARPARMPQLRGSFMVDWDDLLPPVPVEVRDANAAFVAARLGARWGRA